DVTRRDLVERDDVRMVERGDGLGLALEPCEPIRVLHDVGGQDLDRYIAPKPRVFGAIDLAHASSAEGAENLVRSKTSAGGQAHRRSHAWARSVCFKKWRG